MINREEITKMTTGEHTGYRSITEVLDLMLEGVSPVEYGCEKTPEVDNEVLEASRTDLTEGGFGDASTEQTGEDDDGLLEAFFTHKDNRNYQIHASTELLRPDGSEYQVCGVFRDETDKFYLLSEYPHSCGTLSENSYGLIVSKEHFLRMLNPEVNFEGYDYFGSFINDGWVFYRTDADRSHITLSCFDMVTRLFSRNTGLLESSVMNSKSALIVGCGSVGSLISLELARAGVGKFILVDSDTLEIHNICRHQLGFRDLGRYKVDAVSDAIHNINPSAEVVTFRGVIQNLPSEYISQFTDGIIIGTGDNRESSAFANDLAKFLKVPFVSTGCWQRAFAGECFYWYPDSGLPLYREALSEMITDERPTAHQNYFADDYDEENLRFEPGVSTDIGFVTLVAVKIIYDLLNIGTEGYTQRVINYLTNYTWVCNTNNPSIGGRLAGIFDHPLYITNNVRFSCMAKTAGKESA